MDEDGAAVERFLDRRWRERGRSRNTQASYRSDLSLFARWLAPRGTPLAGAAEADLREYFAAARRSARTQARLLSNLPQFYRYLNADRPPHDDPSPRLDAARPGQNGNAECGESGVS